MCSRGVIVKDDNGYRAVFTEQGASASQIAGATSLDTVSRLAGMAREADDAVSAYTQVRTSEAPRRSRFAARYPQLALASLPSPPSPTPIASAQICQEMSQRRWRTKTRANL